MEMFECFFVIELILFLNLLEMVDLDVQLEKVWKLKRSTVPNKYQSGE